MWSRFWIVLVLSVLSILGTRYMATSSPYAYENWSYGGVGVAAMLGVLLLSVVLAALLPARLHKPSSLALWFVAVVAVIPTVVSSLTYVRLDVEIRAYASGLALLGYIVLFLVVRHGPMLRLPKGPIETNRAMVRWSAILGVVFLVFCFASIGFNTSGLSFVDVYVRRSEYALNVTGLTVYVVQWAILVVAPLVVIVGCQFRRGSLVVLGLAIGLVVFSVSGQKYAAVTLVSSFAFWLITRRDNAANRQEPRIPLVGLFFVLLLGIPWLVLYFSGNDSLFYLITRRVLVSPGRLSVEYAYYFWEGNSPGLLAPIHSLLNGSGDSLSVTIGDFIDPTVSMNANSSFLSYGLVTGGLFGVLLYSLLVGMLFILADGIAATRPVGVMVPFLGITMGVLAETFLHTSLLTHGVVFALLLGWLIPVATADGGMEDEESAQGSAFSELPSTG